MENCLGGSGGCGVGRMRARGVLISGNSHVEDQIGNRLTIVVCKNIKIGEL